MDNQPTNDNGTPGLPTEPPRGPLVQDVKPPAIIPLQKLEPVEFVPLSPPEPETPATITPTTQSGIIASVSSESDNGKSRAKLIAAIVLAVILVGLVTTFLILRGNADQVATDYSVAARAYLDRVDDVLVPSSKSPIDAKDEVAKLKRPTLDGAYMGQFISSKYQSAMGLRDSLDSKIDATNRKLKGYIAVYNVFQANDRANRDISLITAASGSNEYQTSMLNILGQLKTSLNDNEADVPTELHESLVGMAKYVDDMVKSYQQIVEATKSKDESAKDQARLQGNSASSNYSTASQPVKTYYDDIVNKLKACAEDINHFTDSASI